MWEDEKKGASLRPPIFTLILKNYISVIVMLMLALEE
jgi:hypothetical protein